MKITINLEKHSTHAELLTAIHHVIDCIKIFSGVDLKHNKIIYANPFLGEIVAECNENHN